MAIIRKRTPTDLDAAAEVLVAVHDRDGYPVEGVADPVGWLTTDGLVDAWVAEEAGRIVGHVAMLTAVSSDAARLWAATTGRERSDALELARLFVHPDVRGRGAGTDLTRAVMTAAAEQERPLVLDVMTKDTAAIRTYERLGWTRIGTADHEHCAGTTPAVCYVAPVS